MPGKKVLVIVSITSGSQKSVISTIENTLERRGIDFDIIRVTSPPDIANKMRGKTLDKYIAVMTYGGDGTVLATLKIIAMHALPVVILPGGTANVLANYFNMPPSVEECLDMYAEKSYVTEYVDVATMNGDPMILEMHTGLWTKAILNTPRSLKKKIGQAAYGWSAIKQSVGAPQHTFSFKLDNKNLATAKGYALLVVNQGHPHILGETLFSYDHSPGILQIALVKDIRLRRLLAWYLARKFGRNLESVIETHRAKSIKIQKSPTVTLIDDAKHEVSHPVFIEAGDKITRVLVPPQAANKNVLRHISDGFGLLVHRMTQRTRSMTFRDPLIERSHVAPGLYLGGKYASRSYRLFTDWGVTGIVNMRTKKSAPAPSGIELLDLPTKDWSPPTIDQLRQGSDFIHRHISNKGAVYVHCQLGEGRGPTMAVAYLITQGFDLNDAIRYVSKNRPIASPNPRQRKRLAQWQEIVNKTDSPRRRM